ncbi:MAG: hypothetical protein RLZZ596_2237 [Pseudomonadota bacterium]
MNGRRLYPIEHQVEDVRTALENQFVIPIHLQTFTQKFRHSGIWKKTGI